MQTVLAPEYAQSPTAKTAQNLLKQCVHCGFCTATCPTYQLLGDELDGPRGRIYLIKEVIEGNTPTRTTQMHLDRCLTCRSCESTCPSGVQYGHLIDIGRTLVEEHVPRPWHEQCLRWTLKHLLVSPWFARLYRWGQWFKPLLPSVLAQKLHPTQDRLGRPKAAHAQRVLLLEGCVQNTMMPNVNDATHRVLDAMGFGVTPVPQASCCGALAWHLSDEQAARMQMRHNIDAWWPHLQGEHAVSAILMNASGCGVMVKDYAHVFKDDPLYREKAQRVSELTMDLGEFFKPRLSLLQSFLPPSMAKAMGPVVFHPPCTLQHGQQIKGLIEGLLEQLGFDLRMPSGESHLCCGSAGTYSILQSKLSEQLKTRKLQHLQNSQAQWILSANVGCISHLQSQSPIRVSHWIEAVDSAMAPSH